MSHTASVPNETSGLSLLSLSAVAASAAPIPISPPSGPTTGISLGAPGSLNGHMAASGLSKHRRLSSTGKARRRLSDARDAATRPSATSLQTAAAALATLSLSASPPAVHPGLPNGHRHTSASFTAASNDMNAVMAVSIPARGDKAENGLSQSVPDDGHAFSSPPPNELLHQGLTKGGKKRGTTFTCESCSKVYRHPSCLIKHRWEHSPQWREASKFVLSKHQQVQLLEAAAILSHLSPDNSGTSLPEDRSLWPSFVSGGQMPPPAAANLDDPTAALHPTSSSVPATSMLGAGRPRMHDYSLPLSGSGLTELRPGVLGVNTSEELGTTTTPGSASLPVPVPTTYRDQHQHHESWGSPASSHYTPSYQRHDTSSSISISYQSPLVSLEHSQSFSRSFNVHSHSHSLSNWAGGWSLPRSSIRSMSISRSSRSRSPSGSGSGSKSADEDEPAEVKLNDDQDQDLFAGTGFGGRYGVSVGSRGRYSWNKLGGRGEDDEMGVGFSVREEDEDEEVKAPKREEEEEVWDGMDMEMEMD